MHRFAFSGCTSDRLSNLVCNFHSLTRSHIQIQNRIKNKNKNKKKEEIYSILCIPFTLVSPKERSIVATSSTSTLNIIWIKMIICICVNGYRKWFVCVDKIYIFFCSFLVCMYVCVYVSSGHRNSLISIFPSSIISWIRCIFSFSSFTSSFSWKARKTFDFYIKS